MKIEQSGGALKKTALVAALSSSLALSIAPAAFCTPEIFGTRSFEDGQAQAKKASKMLVVDFMAEWCGPCKQMDKVSWPEAGVFAFLKKNAVSVQIDVDKRKDIAKKYGITGMPTIMIFRGPDYDKPFDRAIGMQNPNELLTWLKGAQAGKKHVDVMRDALKADIGKGGQNEVKARFRMAQNALGDKNYDAAADEAVWLWKNIPKEAPHLMAARGTAVADLMAHICKIHPAAKAKFKPLRDAIEADATKGKSPMVMDDWMTLNDALGEKDRTFKWFDRIKSEKGAQGILVKGGFRLVDVLISANRWKDILFIYPDPKATLKRSVQLKRELPAHETEFGHKIFRVESAVCYAGLLANKKDAEASELAQLILKEDQSTAIRAGMVRMALSAGEPRKEQLEWLKDLPEIAKAVKAKLK